MRDVDKEMKTAGGEGSVSAYIFMEGSLLPFRKVVPVSMSELYPFIYGADFRISILLRCISDVVLPEFDIILLILWTTQKNV